MLRCSLLVLALSCLLALAGAQANGKCPAGWLNRPSSDWCYQMSDNSNLLKTWTEAKMACELQHGFLLSIADQDERVWLAQKINPYATGDRFWWFGLSRFDGPWKWDDGHTGNEQPGRLADGSLLYYWSGISDSTPGDCMTIYQDRGSRNYIRVWPQDCNKKYKYVCKKLKQAATTCDADNGWEMQNNRCYKVHNFEGNEGLNWDEARDSCNADESDLASIPDQETNVAVRNVISRSQGTSSNFWIGLRTYADAAVPSGYSWRWVDSAGLTYESWSTGSRPNVSPDVVGNTCVQTVGTDEGKLWRNYACNGGRFGYVCARSVGTCPTGWYLHRDSCYLISATEISWDEADTYCRARNASMMQIKQKHIQDFINVYKDDFSKLGINYIWIGLYGATGQKKLTWSSGGDADKTFTNWEDGQPQLESSRPNAARIVASNDEGRWQTANPVDKGGYVCEIALGQVPQVPTPPPPRYSCDDGWLLYGRNCYKVEVKYVDWLTARDNCRDLTPGADLADIRDVAEQEFTQGRLTTFDAWIGLHTRNSETPRWVWSAGENPASYFNWNDGEPNNGEGEENCVEMYVSGKWNDIRCTYKLPYICKVAAHADGTPPTVLPTTSPNWDPFCGPFWSRDLLSSYCYLFNTDTLAWVDAKHQCEYQGGKLLSIVSVSEKSYIAGRMQEVVATNPGIVHFWIGFNDRAEEGYWVWDDGAPVPYLNWNSGEPNDAGEGEDCAIIYPVTATWYDVPCQKRYASICKKLGNVQPTVQPPPATTISVPGGYLRGCRSGYTGFGDMCYRVYGAATDVITWDQAQQNCRSEGGNLASVTSAAEHQFLLELAKPQGEFGFWIGFYDSIANQRTMFFQWSDRSELTYTDWHINEPSKHSSKDDCVEIVNMWDIGWNGHWNDLDCSWERRYACKQRQVPVLVTPPVTRPYGCPEAFDEAYDGYCLKFVAGSVPLTSDAAKQKCTSIGGTLATIPSENVQNHFFLRITQLRASSDFWLGLTRSLLTFRWDDGRPVTFTYWKPGLLFGTRASMSAQTGLWQMSMLTSITYTNYVCQTRQPGQTTPVPTYNPAYCANGWIEADNTCYKGFIAPGPSSRRSWTEARTQCKTLGGDLATISSEGAVAALRQTVGGNTPYWIGLNTRDENRGFVWADGKPASFFKWRNNQEPENINDNQNCALLNPSDMAWTISSCSVAQNWLCETPKGIYPTGTTPEPTTAPDAPDCGDGWKYYSGSCYLLNSQPDDWHKSRTNCVQKGGDLVSIHSHEENDFLVGQISKMHVSSTSYWIGLNELGQSDGFRWSDGTGANYFNWNIGEPNNWGGAEHCSTLYSNTGLWNDDQCGLKFYSICKRNNDTRTAPPATQMPGKCPKEFYTVGNKCYRIFDDVQVTWEEAKSNCDKLGGERKNYLASISNEYEQAALTTMRPKDDTPLWIGLYARNYDHHYLWHDNTEVTYTNWDYNEPNSYVEQCVEMYTEKFRAGKWNDASCGLKRSYMCMTYKNPSLVTDWIPPTMVSCKAGWTAYGQACFLFVANAATWEGALVGCSSNGGQLASIHDLWEQSHVHFRTETIGRFSTWIGLQDADGSGQYRWSDTWPVTYTNWGRGQPDGGGKANCVNMDNSGGWVADDCSRLLPYMCRQSFGAEPTTIPHLEGTCPNEFVPFGESCYYIGNNTESKTAQEAQYECSKRYRSTLASILSQGEQNFVAAQIRAKSEDENTRSNYWIGLLRGGDGGFEWYDLSPVSYLYWSNGEPSNTANENCVEMYHLNLKWNDHFCSRRNSFVCKMPKWPSTGSSATTGPHGVSTSSAHTRYPPHTQPPDQSTSASTTPKPTKSPGGIRAIADLTNDGLVAGVVILFIIILAVLVTAVFFYRRHTGPSPKLAGESGFANANWSKATDEVNLENSSAPRVQIQLDSGLENPSYSA